MTSRRFTKLGSSREPPTHQQPHPNTDIYKKSVCFSDDSCSELSSSSFCDEDSAGVTSPARVYRKRQSLANQAAVQQQHDMIRQRSKSSTYSSRSKSPTPLIPSYTTRSKSPTPLIPSYTTRSKSPTPLIPSYTTRSKSPTHLIPTYISRSKSPGPIQSSYVNKTTTGGPLVSNSIFTKRDQHRTEPPSYPPERDAPRFRRSTTPSSSSTTSIPPTPYSILKRADTESSSASETSSTVFRVHHVSRPKTPQSRPKTPTSRPKTPTSRAKTPTYRSKTPTMDTGGHSSRQSAVESRHSRRSLEPRAEDRMLTNCWTSIRDKSSDRRRERSCDRLRSSRDFDDDYTNTPEAYCTLPRPFTSSKPTTKQYSPEGQHVTSTSYDAAGAADDEEVSELLNSRDNERFYYTEVVTDRRTPRKQWGSSITQQYKQQDVTSPPISPPAPKVDTSKVTSGIQSVRQPPPSPMKESRYKKNAIKAAAAPKPLTTVRSNTAVRSSTAVVSPRTPARPTTPSNLRRTPLFKSMGRLNTVHKDAGQEVTESNLTKMSSLGKSLCDSLSPRTDHNSNVIYDDDTKPRRQQPVVREPLVRHAPQQRQQQRTDTSAPLPDNNQADLHLAIDEVRKGRVSVADRIHDANWVLSDSERNSRTPLKSATLLPQKAAVPRPSQHPLIDHSRPFSPFTQRQKQRNLTPDETTSPAATSQSSIGIPLFGSSSIFNRRKSVGVTVASKPDLTTMTPASPEVKDDDVTPSTRTLPRRYARRKTLGNGNDARPHDDTSSGSAVQRLLKYTRAKSCERLDDICK